MSERISAVGTGVSGYGLFLLYRNADVIPAAVGLDGVFGYAEIVGDSGVAFTFAAQICDSLFLHLGHTVASIRRGKRKTPSPSTGQRGVSWQPKRAIYSVLMKASTIAAAFTLASIASAFALVFRPTCAAA